MDKISEISIEFLNCGGIKKLYCQKTPTINKTKATKKEIANFLKSKCEYKNCQMLNQIPIRETTPRYIGLPKVESRRKLSTKEDVADEYITNCKRPHKQT